MSQGSRPGTEAPVFVTGGSGFVGSHLVEALQARGLGEVRCLVRTNPGWLKDIPHTPISGDLDHVEPLARAMEGCQTVFHVAGRTRARTWAEFEQANVIGTINLLEAAASLPRPPRVVVVSSLASVGQSSVPEATEVTPLKPVSMYGRSKAEMEQRIAPFHERLRMTIVRPSAVYGPRDSDIFEVFKAASRGVFAIVGGSRGPAVTLVHVSDLVAGIIRAGEEDSAIGQTYFLGADPAYSWEEMRIAVATALGRRVVPLRIPPALIVPVGAAVEWAAGLFGSYPPLNREKALEIRDACIRCSSRKAEIDLGYAPETPLNEGFKETAAWYREAGWLSGG